MNNNGPWLAVVAVLGLIAGGLLGGVVVRDSWRTAAVEKGYAVWSVESNGATEFHWKCDVKVPEPKR